jgi:hypothetical protein
MIRQFIHKIFLIALLIFCTGNIYSQATVTSDQADYAPMSTATFIGSGFQGEEQVQLVVYNVVDSLVNEAVLNSWIVTANEDGTFITTWQVCDCLGATLRATADGLSSGLHAEVMFTDGNLNAVSIGTQSGVINYGTGTSVTYPVNVSANPSPAGSFGVTMSISGLPAGVTFSFSPATFTLAPGATQPVTLTVTTFNTTKVPTNPSFNVTATGGGGSGSKSGAGTLTITKKAISGSITVNNKIYDGTASATIATRTLTGVLAGDVVNYTGGTATFSNKNAGIGKTVNATGLSLTGADAGNYSVNTTASATADISQKSITGSINAQNKVYNGSTIAVINNRSLTGDIPSDDVDLTGGTGNFDDKNVGTNKPVTFTGYSLTGTDAGNYNLTSVATASANITPLGITGSFTAANKVYDATTTATVLTRTANSIIAPDDVSLIGGTATFDTKNIGTGKVVTLTGASLSGADAFNYSLTAVGTTTANITVLSITGSFTAANKIYDATTTATVLTRTANGIIAPDDADLTGGTAAFDDKNVGIGKTVALTGYSLTGADAGNYNLTSIGTTTATILALGITGSFTASDKIYDGNTDATVLIRTANNIIAPDDISLTGGTASFDDKNVGTAKTVSLTGAVLSGTDAVNYSLTSVGTTTANITQLSITGSFTTADKVYDATTTATVLTRTANSIIAPDDVSLIGGTATFDTKNIGTGKVVTLTGASLSGADAFNYSLTTVGTATANITALSITGSFTAANKIYDATTTATVLTRTANGIIAPDDADLTGGTAAFDDKNVGLGKTVTLTGYSLTGADAGNYTLTSVGTTTATVSALGITGSFAVSDKIYDGTTTATVTTRTANSIIPPDDVSLNDGTATFDNKNVGSGKIVTLTGASLIGADAGNYTLTSVGTTSANITPRSLAITATGVNKVYDGTTAATVTLSDNRISGDVFTDSYASAVFASSDVGVGILISVSGITITGVDAGNYSFNTTATTSANITPLTVVTTVTVTPNPQQYSDIVTYCAKIIGGAIGSTAATSVTFKVGTQIVAANVPLVVSGSDLKAIYVGPLLEPSSSTGQMAPGVHTVTACFNNISTNFSLINATTNLTIIKENTSAFYTGGEFASTGSANASTAGIRLSATVIDTVDANRGNIRYAKVRFKIQPHSCAGAPEAIVYTSWRAVSLISAADTTTGTASLDTVFNIGSCDARTYIVTAEVGGYYTGNAIPVTVTVAKTLNDFITGGGHVVFGAGTGNKSSGIYKSADESKVNFGFNVKYNKNKTNLQGNVNVIIRSGNSVYQVKGIVGGSNGALGVDVSNPANKKAKLTSKVNITDLATGLPVPNGTNATMELKISDKGEPGANIDTYGITIWSTSTGGSLLYSSNWSGVLTNEVPIKGGNIQVRTATSARIGIDNAIDTTLTDLNNIPNSPYAVKVFPNPTDNSRITVSIVGYDEGTKPVNLYVYDVTGKLIYTDAKFCLHDCRETVLNLDGRYTSGTYLINVVIEEKTYHQKLVVQ